MQKLVAVYNDLFDVSSRIKSIDDDYQIYFNRGNCRYELHNLRCKPTKQADIPWKTLDCRVLTWARKTRVENLGRLVKEMNEHNQRLERENGYVQLQRAQSIIENQVRRGGGR
ncbi:MAG: hypothetical protein ACI4MY_03515 [Christensenellales bacterium]